MLIGGLLAACSANTTPPPAEKAAADPAAAQPEETEEEKWQRESEARAKMKSDGQDADWAAQDAEAAAAAAAAILNPASQEHIPLSAAVHSEYTSSMREVTFLTLQSVVDQVTVTATQLNRGNCETFPDTSKGKLPVTLRFGEEVQVEMKKCGKLLEGVVETDLGSFAYTFSAAGQ